MPAYTVKFGDMLSGIAGKFGATEERLLQLNPQIKDVDKIYARQVLQVPGSQAQPGGSPLNMKGNGQEDDPGADAAELFTIDQLAEISQNPDPVTYDLAGDVAALVPEMKKGGITTKNQITAFLANISQETDWLKTLEEYGDESYYRSFLGDQWVYHGRGYIMNTWLDAYQNLSDVLGVDLVSNPDLLAQDKNLAAKAAVWYWNMRDCGPVADQGDFEGVCSLINRGENPPRGPIHGWDDRLAAYERAKSVIGAGAEPITKPYREGSELVTSQTTATGQITLGYDKGGWAYDAASGLYVKSTPDLDHKTNKDGWLWARVGATAADTAVVPEPVPEVRTWPWANEDPWPSGNYQQRHPTRYTWRDDLEEWAGYLIDNYDCWVNTYYDHPEGYWRTETSFDVWGPAGRNDPLDPTLGDTVWNLLFYYEGKPDIDWIIWKAQIWKRATGGFEPFGEDDFTWHYDHIHVTYL